MKTCPSGSPLRRKGSWLFGSEKSWQMASVEGPLEISHPSGRQFFRVETTAREVLLVSRASGERGMRELRLDQLFLPAMERQVS